MYINTNKAIFYELFFVKEMFLIYNIYNLNLYTVYNIFILFWYIVWWRWPRQSGFIFFVYVGIQVNIVFIYLTNNTIYIVQTNKQ